VKLQAKTKTPIKINHPVAKDNNHTKK